MLSVIYILIFLLFPALLIFAALKVPFLKKIGVVILCYLFGMLIRNIGLIPESLGQLQNTISEITVVLAIPMLLFSMNVKSWRKLAGKAILSMVLACVSISIIVMILVLTINTADQPLWQLGALSAGVYTGGTPNLAAIKTALDVADSSYILFHTYDTIISFLYILFVISVGRKVFGKFLPPFKIPEGTEDTDEESNPDRLNGEELDKYRHFFSVKRIPDILLTIGSAAVILAASLGISMLFPKEYSTSIIILLITTFGILASYIKRIRNIERSFQTGMYIIYIFCFVIGSMTDFSVLVNINYTILLFVTASIFGSIILHSILCRIFKVDTDTFIITSISAICSPPFVPVVAAAIGNRRIILSGLTTGIIGYAIGNYLGIAIGHLLKLFS